MLIFIVIIVEVVGYGARAVSADQNPDYIVLPFLIQNLLILLAPSLFSASIYMLLGRIIRVTDWDSRSFIRGRFLTTIFVCGDFVSFLVQVGGTNPFLRLHSFWMTVADRYRRWNAIRCQNRRSAFLREESHHNGLSGPGHIVRIIFDCCVCLSQMDECSPYLIFIGSSAGMETVSEDSLYC